MVALFGKKKEEEKTDAAVADTSTGKKETKQEAPTRTVVADSQEDLARVLKHPRITEKATIGTADNVYVFDVASDTNKQQIKKAIKLVYNVEPVKVHITTIRPKSVRSARTGAKGTKSGGKKAYVYLKKGESISVM